MSDAPATISVVSAREAWARAKSAPSGAIAHIRASTREQMAAPAVATTPALEVECPSNSGIDPMPRDKRYSARGDRHTFAAQTTSNARPLFSFRTALHSVRLILTRANRTTSSSQRSL
jgi:hypothetical protein